MADATMKSGDTWPPLATTLTKADGQPIDLTTADNVKINMRTPTNDIRQGTCTVTNGTLGVVSYTFVPGDTATAGIYKLEWEINFPSGTQTAPNDGYKELLVIESAVWDEQAATGESYGTLMTKLLTVAKFLGLK